MILYYMLEWRIKKAGFLSINDDRQYEEYWQEIDVEKKTKLVNKEKYTTSRDPEKGRKPLTAKSKSALSSSKHCIDLKSNKEKRYSKLLIEEVETVV